jgi:hypothetical protein
MLRERIPFYLPPNVIFRYQPPAGRGRRYIELFYHKFPEYTNSFPHVSFGRKNPKIFYFCEISSCCGAASFFSQGFGPKGPEKRKRFGMIWAEKVDSRPVFHI